MTDMTDSRKQILSDDLKPIVIFLVMIGFIVVVFSSMHEQFLTARNISTMLKHASITAIFALGATFVVVVGHFDLSFPMVCALAGMTNSYLIAQDVHVVPSIGLGLAVCRKIAHEHGATLEATANDVCGCVFRLRWPAA